MCASQVWPWTPIIPALRLRQMGRSKTAGATQQVPSHPELHSECGAFNKGKTNKQQTNQKNKDVRKKDKGGRWEKWGVDFS